MFFFVWLIRFIVLLVTLFGFIKSVVFGRQNQEFFAKHVRIILYPFLDILPFQDIMLA